MQTLYVFIDVSGNYDFSTQGTKNLVLTSLVCPNINASVLELHKLKNEILNQGIDLEYFHAAKDRQNIRNRVFDIITTLVCIRIDSIIILKNKTNPSIRPLNKLYPQMLEKLLKYPFNPKGINVKQFDRVLIFMDRESSRMSEREALKKAVKTYLSHHLKGTDYMIFMHSSTSNPYLQIVDYCSWAIYVKAERDELRPFERIKNSVYSEFDIFEWGDKTYY